ncbi:phage minor capsid protein (plasmid) [Streptomyces sp. NBC_00723]|uniref:phage minor capsid protein n=1 Tax=Streptomyces sp. NBC_00723 TaxID=2903673 RepID=UPI00386C1785
MIVSQTPEECPLCRPWERKILMRDGSLGARTIEMEHATEDDETVTVHVAGSLPEARALLACWPAGLLHPNCRHDISAYLPGVSKVPAPQPSRGTYEDSQKHRYLERQVRRWKRGEQTALDEQHAKAAQVRTREYQARIRELVKETGLPRKAHREQLATAR